MNAAKQRAYRDRKRGGPPRAPAPCGTLAAFRRHQRHGESIDQACREAYNAAQRAYYNRRKHSEPGVGVGPTTYALRVHCSTTELSGRES